jgi:hypothetical protein
MQILYRSTIALRTGVIYSQESELFDNEHWAMLDGTIMEERRKVEKDRNGIYGLWIDEPHELLTCFSLNSMPESLALCVEEFTICWQIGIKEYSKRARHFSIWGVEWEEHWDDPLSTPNDLFWAEIGASNSEEQLINYFA